MILTFDKGFFLNILYTPPPLFICKRALANINKIELLLIGLLVELSYTTQHTFILFRGFKKKKGPCRLNTTANPTSEIQQTRSLIMESIYEIKVAEYPIVVKDTNDNSWKTVPVSQPGKLGYHNVVDNAF